MAFQSGLPSVAAATTELWPSIANTLMVPWRAPTSTSTSTTTNSTSAKSSRIKKVVAAYRPGQSASIGAKTTPAVVTETLSSPAAQGETAVDPKPELPDFFRDPVISQSIVNKTFANASPSNIFSEISHMSPRSLAMANPLFHRSYSALMSRPLGGTLSALRSMSTYLPSRLQSFQGPASAAPSHPNLQYRGFGTGGVSRSLLANREAAANRNPNSATAQNAFYQALLMANMPAIVVERYQSGRFATNEAADNAYQKAHAMLSGSGGAFTGTQSDSLHPSGFSPAQLNGAATVAATHHTGGHMATVKAGANGGGTRGAPLHIVVDESFGSAVLRWIKFLMWFGLVTWISFAVITMVIETMSMFKRPGGKADPNEAKAENQKARFTDVHGCDEAKEELQELIDFLRNPDKFSTLGGKMPKGILLVGPPGTGKTLLARAVAGEAGVPFFFMSGSEFEEVYIGVGAKRVRDLFAAAKAKSPSIVFIDELDAIGGKRNSRDANYARQTLNQLLTELDGFEQNSGVIIIGATNFPESLDKALTRPGRFDRHVVVSLPDVRGRIAILKHHAKRIKAAKDVNFEAIASRTSGLSGAELENIVNQAAIHASKLKAKAVTQKDMEWAKDKIIMGTERRSMVITPKEKEMTAYHEAGHALVAYFASDTSSELYKVTVLPRGQSLGHTAFLPEMDKHSFTVRDYLGYIDRAMGGKVAEEIVYGNELVTSGVSADLDMATRTAWQMVAQLGMSEKLGPVEYLRKYEQLSSETRSMVESEVKKVLDASYDRARKLLLSKRKELDLLAKALVEYETLDKGEVEKVIRGEKLTDRIAVPPGPMAIPKPSDTLEPGIPLPPLPGDATGDGDSGTPPPPPPAAAGQGAASEESRS
ncbi:P-loop containing nucleoside triphosphate hydrolase protein [Bombardia bombarda]|uniref:P-loop containing nucleoside triphosphate hydrolase protein n=1 Tax=Bombardia bombarda TaxID=252184 RepID=A0AA39XID4_9PEZI|nr:P-loop containing nucleoside triphosphate hydrolase protein [Bombardia bombarda]